MRVDNVFVLNYVEFVLIHEFKLDEYFAIKGEKSNLLCDPQIALIASIAC